MDNEYKVHLIAATQAVERGDYSMASSEYKIAAQHGSCEAKICMAELYLAGSGVEENGVVAEALLQEVALDKMAPLTLVALAFNNLSTLYITGAKGITRDEEKARIFKSRALELGFPA